MAAAASFILFGLWTIRGDKLEDEDKRFNFSPFWTVAIAFFLAEMGDKTQIATIALGAQYTPLWAVVGGTTLGMLLANAPVAFWGEALTRRIPVRAMHVVAAVIFLVLGVAVLGGLV